MRSPKDYYFAIAFPASLYLSLSYSLLDLHFSFLSYKFAFLIMNLITNIQTTNKCTEEL